MARRMAMEHAEAAEAINYGDQYDFQREVMLAATWAHVANAMKVGQSLEADGVIETPDPYGHSITR